MKIFQKIFQPLNAWAESWSWSQFLFLLAVTIALLALALYQDHALHVLADQLKALKP